MTQSILSHESEKENIKKMKKKKDKGGNFEDDADPQ